MTATPRSKASKERNKSAQGDESPEDQSPDGVGQCIDLPEGWTLTSVDESIQIIDYRGRTPPFDGDAIPHLRSQNVKSGRIVWNDLAYVSESTYTAFMTRGIPKNGDILFTTEAPLGEVAPVPEERFSVAQRIMVLRPSSKVWCPLFLMYQLMSPEVQARIRRKGTGSTVTGVASRNFKPLELRAAPIDDQRRIVAEIEKQFTRLEAGVAALRRAQANLKRYRAAVLKAACEGRLIPTEAELARAEGRPFESGQQLLARILTERRRNWRGRGKYKEPVELDTAKLFPLPNGWTWTILDALAEIKGGITKDQNRKHSAPTRSIPYLRVANVQRGYIDLTEVKEIITTEDEIKELSLKPGDILFNEGGDRDKLGRGWVWSGQLPECIHQNHVFRARLHVAELNPKLVSWYANTFGQKFFFDEGKHTTNLASISMSKLKSLPIPIPPASEQTRIVAEVERRLSVMVELEAAVNTNLQRATRLRQSILQKAFTGQLVKEQPVKAVPELVLLPAPVAHKAPNRHFARALLSAEIVHRLHAEPTFGRTKHQKIFHLCEHIARIGEIEGQYHREAAGPLDNKLIYANEAELKKQQWYAEVKRDSYGHAYRSLPKAGAHRPYLERYWHEKLPMIEKLIELMRGWKTERCEIFCTAYAAWNDLLIQGREPTDESILHEILDCWNESKKRITKDRWLNAIHWMKKEGWEPQGFGKLTQRMK